MEGVKSKGWIVYGTDKSGKLVLDTLQNFNESMKPHYENENEVSIETVSQSETQLNNHVRSITKMLKMGENQSQVMQQRIIEALMVKHANVPNLLGFWKDHKPTVSQNGPPVRPFCNGKVGPNAPLANLISRLLKIVRSGIYKTYDTEVLSTEEVLGILEHFKWKKSQTGRRNKHIPIQNDQLIFGSMDVLPLYPSCRVAKSTKAII